MPESITPDPNTGAVVTINKIGWDASGIAATNAGGVSLRARDGSLSDVGPYVLNPEAFAPLAKALYKTGAGTGGIDALMLGDSIGEGAVALTKRWHGVGSYLKLGLQQAYNPGPQGLVGGEGFIPCYMNSGNGWTNVLGVTQPAFIWTLSGTEGFKGRRYDSPGNNVVRLDGGTGATLSIAFDGTDPEAGFKRNAITDLAIVTAKNSGATAATWSLLNNTTSTTVNGTWNTSGTSAGLIYTVAGLQGLNPAQSYTLTVGPGTTGNIWLAGCVAYKYDRTQGIRFHNECTWGARLVDDGTNSNGFLDVNSAVNQALAIASQLGLFATESSLALNTLTGPKRTKIVYVAFAGTNDNTANVPPTTYRLMVDVLNAAIIAAGAVPVWLLHPASQNQQATYYAYGAQVVAAAKASNKTVAVVDLAGMLGYPTYGPNSAGGFMFDRGWAAPDLTHYYDGYHQWAGRKASDATISAVAWCRANGLGY